MNRFSFEELDAYKYARALVRSIYASTNQFPVSEQYALTNQLRRAVISIPSNIAEGMGRVSVKEQVHFVEIAYGSLMEVLCQLQLAKDLEYLSAEEMAEKRNQIQKRPRFFPAYVLHS
jgi:S23 ribosomal protein.